MSNRGCGVEGCDGEYRARGFCRKHYHQPGPCAVAGCGRPVTSAGYCDFHHFRKFKGRPLDVPNRRRRWTAEEDQVIVAELRSKPYGKRDWASVARVVDRTRAACQARSTTLRGRDRRLLIETG